MGHRECYLFSKSNKYTPEEIMEEILKNTPQLYEDLKQKAKFEVKEYDDYMRYNKGIEDYTAKQIESYLLDSILEYIDNNDIMEGLARKFEMDYPGYIESIITTNCKMIYATEHKEEYLKLGELLDKVFYNNMYLEELDVEKNKQEYNIKDIEENLKSSLEKQNYLKNKKYKFVQLFNGDRKNDNILQNEISNKIKDISADLEQQKKEYESLNKKYNDIEQEKNSVNKIINNISDNLKYDYKKEIEKKIANQYYLHESYDLETTLDYYTEYKTTFIEENRKLEKMQDFVKQTEIEQVEEYSIIEDEENGIINQEENKFNYQMLDRLKSDCEYFLGNGRGNLNCLYYKNIDKQIDEMKKIYNSFEDDKKPEWLTLEDINEYEKDMKVRLEICNQFKNTFKKIPDDLKIKYYNQLSNIDYNVENYQLRGKLEDTIAIVDNLSKIDMSKEKINVIVLWSESNIYEDNTCYTLSEMQRKSYLAIQEINEEKERIGLDKIYDKTKYIMIGKENNSLIFYKDRYDIGDYKSFIDDFTRTLTKENFIKFAKLNNSLLDYANNLNNKLEEKEIEEITENNKENRVENIKNFLGIIKDMNYRDFFCSVLLNEVIESKQDIINVDKNDIKQCDKFYDEYIQESDMKLLSEEIHDMLDGNYDFEEEQEIQEEEDEEFDI